MSAHVEVKGRDVAREAYRIETDAGRAFVPECLMTNALRPGYKPTHQDAYECIAAHRQALILAVDCLAAGAAPRPPYDIMTLIEAR
ncbi:hypothetical protein [Antarctobacter heliothermus]|uniref:Uncharacterized protein n=1 Tax=Antarctobacter heliothermus TaxID=74033 RepID=A0A239D6N5_9RHOB|nr:hypothetical protein [Antarctobacter heliothermus]SNS28045.1 hypothetical protein SAMN04488078_1009110 [Antarctobacter heliothermus]